MGLLSGKKTTTDEDKSTVVQIPIERIVRDENQPRKRFRGIEELAESIKTTNGIQTPLHVLKIEDERYRIISGERRYLAAQHLVEQGEPWRMLGEAVPCIVHQKDDLAADVILRMQLIENLQREDLTAIEEARGYQKLIEQGLSQRRLAKELGKSEALISLSLSILEMPATMLAELEKAEPPVAKRDLIRLAHEKDEAKRQALLEVLLKKESQEEKEDEARPVEAKGFTSDEVWELLKRLMRKDKEALLKLISPAKVERIKKMLEEE